jgi:ADP-heptose:LPS heptosyltransferase
MKELATMTSKKYDRNDHTIIISPYSRVFPPEIKNRTNAKNYPYWDEVVASLKKDFTVIQIGIEGEPAIKGIDDFHSRLSFKQLRKMADDCDTWISVDNFFPHMANIEGKRGVVIFGKSDPNVFGYGQNVNLLKDRKYLRAEQFKQWFEEEANEDVFVRPQEVVDAVYTLLKRERQK